GRAAAGEDVGAELAELEDPELVADAALAEKEAEARAAAREEEGGEEAPDPYGRDGTRDSDEDYEGEQDSEGSQGGGGGGPPLPPACTMDEVIPRAPFHVMLTCYTLFERDSPEQRADRAFLEKWRWSHLIMDEAHALKNRLAARTTRLRRVANATRRRIMMTGTPLQNDLAELQNLLHFLLPQVFAEQGIEDLAEMLADESEIAKLTARMKALLGPFVLRRLKTEVAGQLTNKEHRVEFLPMAAEQAKLYQESVARYRAALPGRAGKERDKERDRGGEKSDKQVEKFLRTLGAKRINHMFTHLRKIAQHPLLVRHRFDEARVDRVAALAHERALFSGNATPKRVREELLSYSDYSLHAFCYNAGPDFAEFLLSSEQLHSSSKFVFLAKLLPRLKAAGSRPLIFSQWTAVLDVMEWLMDELQLPYVRMDGSTAVEERLATVDRFNNCPEVFAFLLSTRAGGQGLNLVGADTVILHDVDFNPQIDRQAEDRCHRLGQTKPVTVYRLVTEGSVDQNIYDLSQRKLKLDAAVLDGITTTSTKVGETAA
ncbi:SNF2 family domain-containing protein, partial [Helicosporidium sp. ATCC 50920]